MDWSLTETLIVIGVIAFFIVIGAIIAGSIELYNKFKSYEKPIKNHQISPRQWKAQGESWEDRIMRG